MADLAQLDTDTLKRELERRRHIQVEASRPTPLAAMNWAAVVKMCREHVEEVWRDGWRESDYAHYIYEAAVEAVYGPHIFKGLNERNSLL